MISIKEAAERVNLSPPTLRYYEAEGLLPWIKRDANGKRMFDEKDFEWIGFIRCLRNTGMSIKEMKAFVELYQGGHETLPQRMEILYQHKAHLQDEMAQMEQYMKNINGKINWYKEAYSEQQLNVGKEDE